jgi:hypothetical protein
MWRSDPLSVSGWDFLLHNLQWKWLLQHIYIRSTNTFPSSLAAMLREPGQVWEGEGCFSFLWPQDWFNEASPPAPTYSLQSVLTEQRPLVCSAFQWAQMQSVSGTPFWVSAAITRPVPNSALPPRLKCKGLDTWIVASLGNLASFQKTDRI